MSGANDLRGEVALRLNGRELLLRPTFGRLVAAEAETGSLFALVERAVSEDVRLADMAALFWHCLDEEQERSAFEEALLAAGVASLLPVYRTLLTRMFAGS